MKLVKKDNHYNYELHNFDYIKKHHAHFIEYANLAYKRFQFAHSNSNSSTKLYRYYNFFQLVTGSIYYHKLYKNLITIIKKYNNSKERLWLQCWINYQNKSEVLNWHSHMDCLSHGYISIDPKETETHFENYKIKNEIGNIYIGEANVQHKVVNLSNYNDKRITLGFDVLNQKCYKKLISEFGNIDVNLSFIPI